MKLIFTQIHSVFSSNLNGNISYSSAIHYTKAFLLEESYMYHLLLVDKLEFSFEYFLKVKSMNLLSENFFIYFGQDN